VKVLALDFDGVISDSAREAFVVAFRTYRALAPDSRLPDDEATRAAFLEAMPLGNRAEDFGVVLAAIDAGERLADQRDYDRFRDGLPRVFAARFHARFYAERSAFARRDPAGWLRLMAPYPAVTSLLRRRAGARRLAIATAKDRPSVEALLDAYGLRDLFEPQLVLDKEAGTSKRAHLCVLCERTGARCGDVTFVDDKVNHLEDVADLGVRPVLAAWGYNGARERRRARDCGFEVATPQNAEALLFA